MTELTTNRSIENAAIEHILRLERDAGRVAKDARSTGLSVDIDGDRLIEVKAYGRSARGQDLWMEPRQFDAAKAEPERFHLVIVENVRQGNPTFFKVLDIHGDRLESMLAGARPRSYYEVPFSTKMYDLLSGVHPGRLEREATTDEVNSHE